MPEDRSKCVELGPTEQFDSLPSEVEIEGKRFFLGRRDGDYVLLSSLCPHRGGPVLLTSDGLECPMHGWSFDGTTGEADGCEGDGLEAYEVDRSGEILTVSLPADALEKAHPSRSVPSPDPEDVDIAIEPSTCVGDLLEALGEPAIELFHEFGFACLGCALADKESIRRAARRHHLTDDDMHELLERLRTIRDAQ